MYGEYKWLWRTMTNGIGFCFRQVFETDFPGNVMTTPTASIVHRRFLQTKQQTCMSMVRSNHILQVNGN